MVEMRKLVENIRVQEALADLVAQLHEESRVILKAQEDRSRKMLEEATLVLQGLSRKVADIERDSVERVKALAHELGMELAESITRELQQNLVRKAAETASQQVDAELQKSLSKLLSNIQGLDSFFDKMSRYETTFYEQMTAQRSQLTDSIRTEMAMLQSKVREIGLRFPDPGESPAQTTPSERKPAGGSTVIKLNELISAADKRMDDLRQESNPQVSSEHGGGEELDSVLEGLQSVTRDQDDFADLEDDAKEDPQNELDALAAEMEQSGGGLSADEGAQASHGNAQSDDFLNQLIEDEKSGMSSGSDEIGDILESAAGEIKQGESTPRPMQQEAPKAAIPSPTTPAKPAAINAQDKKKGLDDLNALLDELKD